MSRIIIFSTGVVQERLIGPEIRVWEFAKNLSRKGHDVTLAVPNSDFPSGLPFHITRYTDDNFNALTKGKEVAVLQGDVCRKFIRFAERIPTVYDLYDPYVIECLYLAPASFPTAVHTLRTQLMSGDFFLCSSESQRLFYLGMLTMLGRLDSAQFPKFNTFENLIDLVPFGAAEENLSFARTRETGKYQKVFLGGIYTWYDPFASLDCLKIIWRKRDDIKFVFVRFPFDIAAVKKMEGDVLEYADRIGVQDNIIFTNWVSYEERSILYADIDIALVVHRESLEAALSFRTRILDFLSFGIPVIANKGGDLEKELEDHACGIIVNNNNPEILAEAVLALVEDRKKSEAIIARGKTLVKNKYLWEKVIEPLDKFCRNPSFSARIGSVSNATTIIGEDESVIQQSLRTYKTYGALRLLRKGLKYFMKTR